MVTNWTGKTINGSPFSVANDDFDNKPDSSEYDQFERSTASESHKESVFFKEKGRSLSGLEEGFRQIDIIPTFKSFEPSELPQHNIEAQFIIRKHISYQILASLKKIQDFFGEPSTAIYARKILELILDMRDRIPFDSFLDVAMALYDALSYKNSWVKYTADQYEGAYQIFNKLIDIKEIKDEKSEKAILELEELGFNILPFELSIEPDSEA